MDSRSENREGFPGDAGEEGSQDSVLVGIVIRPQALRGEVRIQIHSDVEGRFAAGQELLLKVAGQAPQTVLVESFRPIRGGGVIRFDGYTDRNQVETLRGARLEVGSDQVPAAPEGLFYHFELVGCQCIDGEFGDLGRVRDVVEDGGGLLLEVEGGGRKLSVPFVESFVDSVDVREREIRLQLPPGLVEICTSKS